MSLRSAPAVRPKNVPGSALFAISSAMACTTHRPEGATNLLRGRAARLVKTLGSVLSEKPNEFNKLKDNGAC
jgi:hypothetical protein